MINIHYKKQYIKCLIVFIIVIDIIIPTLYNFFSISPNEIKQILYQEWNSGSNIPGESLLLVNTSFMERGIQLKIGKKYPLIINYMSTRDIIPTKIVEALGRSGYILQKTYGDPENEAVYELKKVKGRYKDNLSCVMYIKNNRSLEIEYQYTT